MVSRLPTAVNRAQIGITLAAMGWAWRYADSGDMEAAREAYRLAEGSCPDDAIVNERLSMLRHQTGSAEGLTVPLGFTENVVPLLGLPDRARQVIDEYLPCQTPIDSDSLAANIRRFIDEVNPGFHARNVNDSPHVMVLSTGRSGTVSLYRLLRDSNVVPYHHYWFHVQPSSRWEVMCRLISGEYGGGEVTYQEWLSARAAEWLGPESQGRIMVGLNHWDTIMSPLFAALHKNSKFVYLRRDPVSLFDSLYDKGQYGMDNLRPLRYSLKGGFSWQLLTDDPIKEIAWYIRFTEAFCRAMGNVMGDRFMEVQAESLFTQDRSVIASLLDFIGADIPIDKAVEHFGTVINEKKHKVQFSEQEMDEGRAEFAQAYRQFSA